MTFFIVFLSYRKNLVLGSKRFDATCSHCRLVGVLIFRNSYFLTLYIFCNLFASIYILFYFFLFIYHRKIQRLDSDGKFKRNDSCAVAFWTFLSNCPCVALSDPLSNDQLDLRAFLTSYLKMKVYIWVIFPFILLYELSHIRQGGFFRSEWIIECSFSNLPVGWIKTLMFILPVKLWDSELDTLR